MRTALRLDSEVSFLAWELRPTALDDLGLPDAAKGISRNGRITIRSSRISVCRVSEKPHAGRGETHFYRILQEALNNVAAIQARRL
jgi:signal transduction histidine kinase